LGKGIIGTRITGEWLPWLWLALILSHSVVY
jgi:hypothetical protein